MSRGSRWCNKEDFVLVETLTEFVKEGIPIKEAFDEISKRLSLLGYQRSERAAYQHWLTDLEPIYGEVLGLQGATPIRPLQEDRIQALLSKEEGSPEELEVPKGVVTHWSESFDLVRSSTNVTLGESFTLLNELFLQLEEENRLLKEENERLTARQAAMSSIEKKEKLFQQLEQKLKEVSFT